MKFNTNNNTKFLSFIDITSTFSLRKNDSIIDVAGGKNFILVLTENGDLHGLGKTLKIYFDQVLNENQELGKSFQINSPPNCKKLVRVWASSEAVNAWVTGEIKNEENEETKDNENENKQMMMKTWSIGELSHLNGNEELPDEASPEWVEPTIPKDIYFVEIYTQGSFVYGIDNKN